jgi:putative transposase
VSIRRACRVLDVDTSTYHDKSRRPEQAGLERRTQEISQTRVRYGDRRTHVLLRREGWPVNHKKTRRIYEELGLQLSSKTPKAAGQGRAARGSLCSHAAERDLGDRLCA